MANILRKSGIRLQEHDIEWRILSTLCPTGKIYWWVWAMAISTKMLMCKQGNETYSAWAERMWDWLASTPNLTPDYQVNDGSAIRYNCTDTNHDQWSYNYGTMIMGSAYMYTIVSPR